jgi:hypothetical protein
MRVSKPRLFNGEGSAIDDYNKAQAVTQNDNNNSNTKNWGLFDKNNSKHKRIQANLRTAQIVVKNERHGEVADMKGWFNRFLKSNRSPIKKPLMDMTPVECSKIIKALDGVVVWKHSI